MLASNLLAELSDLDVLGKFARLEQLVLMDNPVTKKEVRLVPPVVGAGLEKKAGKWDSMEIDADLRV